MEISEKKINNPKKNGDFQEEIAKSINTSLDSAATRTDGLQLLINFSSSISNDDLLKWISKLMEMLKHSPNDITQLDMIFRAICALIVRCKQVPEIDKRSFNDNIKKLLQKAFKYFEPEQCLPFLNLFVILLYHFPDVCAPHQDNFSNIFSASIDKEDESEITATAKCYSLLVMAGERKFNLSGTNSSNSYENNSANCHIAHQINFCKILNDMMDMDLFQDLVSSKFHLPDWFKQTKSIVTIELSEISRQNLKKYYDTLGTRFSNICKYLSMLLKVGGCKGKKSFCDPYIIFQTVQKGLIVTPSNLQKKSNKDSMIFHILPKIYSSLLDILTILIDRFGKELMPLALRIQQLLLHLIEWTKDDLYLNIRIHAYKVLTKWIEKTSTLSGFHLVSDKFVDYLLKDLLSRKFNVLLNTKTGKSSKKDEIKHPQVEECTEFEYSELNIQVLTVIRAIASKLSILLKPVIYSNIRNAIVLLAIEEFIKNKSKKLHNLKIDFKLQLVRALRCIQTSGHYSTASPTCYSIMIFNTIINQENDLDIVEEARSGLTELQHIVYPPAPTLMFQLPKEQNEYDVVNKNLLLAIEDQLSILREKRTIPYEIDCDDADSIIEEKRPKKEETLEKPTEKKTATSLGEQDSAINQKCNNEESEIVDDDLLMTFCDVPV